MPTFKWKTSNLGFNGIIQDELYILNFCILINKIECHCLGYGSKNWVLSRNSWKLRGILVNMQKVVNWWFCPILECQAVKAKWYSGKTWKLMDILVNMQAYIDCFAYTKNLVSMAKMFSRFAISSCFSFQKPIPTSSAHKFHHHSDAHIPKSLDWSNASWILQCSSLSTQAPTWPL